MMYRIAAIALWLMFMGLTVAIVVSNGMVLDGLDRYLAIAIGIAFSLLASFGSMITFSTWENSKGAASGAIGIVLGCLCWFGGEAIVVLNELSWRSSTVEAKDDAREDDALTRAGVRQRLKKAQEALAALPEVRGEAAIAAEETTALAESVTWAKEKTTLGAVTKKCTDDQHDLYRRCTKVLALRGERKNAEETTKDRERLSKEVEKEQAALSAKKGGGDVTAASRWLAARSGHDREVWETVSTMIMLLGFALGRDVPGYVLGAYKSDARLRSEATPVKRRDPRITVLRATFFAAFPSGPKPVRKGVVNVVTPSPWSPPVKREPKPVVVQPDPVPSRPEPPKPPKAKEAKPQDYGPNVTVLRQPDLDRRPGWETRDWLRETLAKGPMDRAEVVRLGAEAGVNEKALDRAAKAMPEVDITPGKGKRRTVWGLKRPPGERRSRAGGTPGGKAGA